MITASSWHAADAVRISCAMLEASSSKLRNLTMVHILRFLFIPTCYRLWPINSGPHQGRKFLRTAPHHQFRTECFHRDAAAACSGHLAWKISGFLEHVLIPKKHISRISLFATYLGSSSNQNIFKTLMESVGSRHGQVKQSFSQRTPKSFHDFFLIRLVSIFSHRSIRMASD